MLSRGKEAIIAFQRIIRAEAVISMLSARAEQEEKKKKETE